MKTGFLSLLPRRGFPYFLLFGQVPPPLGSSSLIISFSIANAQSKLKRREKPTLFLTMDEEALEVDQIDQLKEIFTRFDMDSDGSLTKLELAALLRSLGLRPSGDQIHIMLAVMDSNGNGTIEFDELVHAILPNLDDEQIIINQGHLLEIFGIFDRDGNGVITAAELAGAMAKMGQPLTYRELTEMIIEADTNGDGVISFNEFASIMAKSASNFFEVPIS